MTPSSMATALCLVFASVVAFLALLVLVLITKELTKRRVTHEVGRIFLPSQKSINASLGWAISIVSIGYLFILIAAGSAFSGTDLTDSQQWEMIFLAAFVNVLAAWTLNPTYGSYCVIQGNNLTYRRFLFPSRTFDMRTVKHVNLGKGGNTTLLEFLAGDRYIAIPTCFESTLWGEILAKAPNVAIEARAKRVVGQ